ncbi:hypothetical protein PCANC_00371 [Puccinia coronata f. sp. avenae]|uniref:Uncharacterized protein n=1 Tax=Puccinia coronata f. sp. avenae TaxID=200324 RepID=A0A2N5W9E9_9BASI|nr:hypothetical protein PCANC_00371 [Puccinia coronata f. sp. avenae]
MTSAHGSVPVRIDGATFGKLRASGRLPGPSGGAPMAGAIDPPTGYPRPGSTFCGGARPSGFFRKGARRGRGCEARAHRRAPGGGAVNPSPGTWSLDPVKKRKEPVPVRGAID